MGSTAPPVYPNMVSTPSLIPPPYKGGIQVGVCVSLWQKIYLTIAPVFADVTILAYLARYPFVIFGGMGVHFFFLSLKVFSSTSNSIFLSGILMAILSPSSISAIGPPSIASGEMCPIHGPCVPPENLPSVINATDS